MHFLNSESLPVPEWVPVCREVPSWSVSRPRPDLYRVVRSVSTGKYPIKVLWRRVDSTRFGLETLRGFWSERGSVRGTEIRVITDTTPERRTKVPQQKKNYSSTVSLVLLT